MMLIIKLQMPAGATIRQVLPVVGYPVEQVRKALEHTFNQKLDDPVIEEGE